MKKRLHWENIIGIVVVHIIAIASIPYFTWPAFGVCILLLFTISPIGVNLTYHRLLTHRGFKVPQWFEYVMATIAAMSGQGSMLRWVAEHRLHHRYSDTQQDPHSPIAGFFHAHVGHLFYMKEFEADPQIMAKLAPDLWSHKYYHFLSKFPLFFVLLPAPFLYWMGGMPFVLYGIPVRLVIMLHVTWSVNSVCHTFGYRNYDTNDTSSNVWWVGLLGAGEGWHNNHHAHPISAAHGKHWWEFDLTYFYIRVFKALGLVTQLKTPVLTKDTCKKISHAPASAGVFAPTSPQEG